MQKLKARGLIKPADARIVRQLKQNGLHADGQLWDSTKKIEGITISVNPSIILVELRGIEPLTS